MKIVEAIYKGLKDKRSPKQQADDLGISLITYYTIKEQIVNATRIFGDKIDTYIVRSVLDSVNNRRGRKDRELLSNLEQELFELEQELGITGADRFHNLKPQAGVVEKHENLEEGTAKITGISSVEPRSPEEIIEILKIDTSKWRLSQYWNKEKGDKWLISALVSRIPQQEAATNEFFKALETHKIPQVKAVDPTVFWLNKVATEKVCGVLSLQDLHFGKPGNEDIGTILTDAVKYLVGKAHASYVLDKLIIVLGPDTLNMDTFNGTTTKGTPVENSESATTCYLKAFDAFVEAITIAKQFCQNLEVIFIPGNHDRLSSFHLLHAVSQAFKDWEKITFNIDYAERKVVTYGDNMLCFEHGDVTAKNNPLVYAVEFPTEWGNSTHRILYTGHYHGRKTKEFVTENEEHGFVTRIIPALTGSDYYHYHNKYVGNKRSALIHLHDMHDGQIAEFAYNVKL